MTTSLAQHAEPVATEGDFLSRLEVKHGPIALLGRFFLKAVSEARERGVSLSFGTLSELVHVNANNADSWRTLLPLFDDRFLQANLGTTFAILGRDRTGRVVATHAARLYDWKNTTFADEAHSLRLFYDDPERMKRPGEALEVTAPSARLVTGPTVFSGAAWYHPDYRGRSLAKILPRVGKAYALTRWRADTIVSFMAEEVHKRGLAPVFGYDNVDWSVFMKNTRVGTLRAAFLSVSRERSFEHIAAYMTEDAVQPGAGADGNVAKLEARQRAVGDRT